MNPSEMPATQLQTAQPADWPVAPGWQPLVDAFFAGARGQALLAFLQARLQAGAAIFPPQPLRALDQLKAVTRWAMQTQLEGEMPTLPAQNSSLSASLQSNDEYMDRLIALSNRLSIWITEAQTSGQLNPALPGELVLYTLFARACDPVVAMLKASGQYTHAQILDWVTSTTFDGMALR